MKTQVEIYKGEKIEREEEGFLFGREGWFDSVEECRAAIDAKIQEDEDFFGQAADRYDTPSLAPAWWMER